MRLRHGEIRQRQARQRTVRGGQAGRVRNAVVAVVAAGVMAVSGGGAAAAQPLAGQTAGGDALVSDPASLVDPLIGTGSGGATVGQVDTYPGATAPFGMMSFSPDTPSRPDGGGYNYDDTSTTGFSLTHMSGPGCGAFGDFPVLPTVGALGADPASTTAAFSHSDEHAAPGSYSVALNPGTAAARAGRPGGHRPYRDRASSRIPAPPRRTCCSRWATRSPATRPASISVVGDNEVAGTETAGQFCGSPGTYPVHFVATFSRPFSSYGTWHTAPTGSNVFTAGRRRPPVELPRGGERRHHGEHHPGDDARRRQRRRLAAEQRPGQHLDPGDTPGADPGRHLPGERHPAGQRGRLPQLLQRPAGRRRQGRRPHLHPGHADRGRRRPDRLHRRARSSRCAPPARARSTCWPRRCRSGRTPW